MVSIYFFTISAIVAFLGSAPPERLSPPGSNRSPVKSLLPLLFVTALLIAAACIEPETSPANGTVTTGPATVTSGIPGNGRPGETPTPAPYEVAWLSGITCAIGDRKEDVYHCNGNVRIRGGGYAEVRVIARYPDNNTFRSPVLALGGREPIQKPFAVFPDLSYRDRQPEYVVELNGTGYPVIMTGTGGTAWANLP